MPKKSREIFKPTKFTSNYLPTFRRRLAPGETCKMPSEMGSRTPRYTIAVSPYLVFMVLLERVSPTKAVVFNMGARRLETMKWEEIPAEARAIYNDANRPSQNSNYLHAENLAHDVRYWITSHRRYKLIQKDLRRLLSFLEENFEVPMYDN